MAGAGLGLQQGKGIMKARTSFCALSLSVVALFGATPAMAAKTSDLFETMDQLDKSDKQDFQAAIDKANACTRARNFPCSASELAKAAKAANSGQDKKTLLASQNSLANEKQQLANEIRRAEEERQAQVRRDEEERQARVRRDEEREARRERDERQARDAEDRQSTSDYNAAIGAQIRQRGAADAALLGKIDRQTSAAIADSNRVLAAQAAERDRARSEREDREADRRRDAERERSARADAERSAARARTSEALAAAPKYQSPVGQGQTQIASNSGSGSGSNAGSGSDRPVSASGTTTRPPASGSSGGNTRLDLPNPTRPVQETAQTSGGLDSQKLYTYRVDSKFRGIGETEAAGCKAAEKDAADWSPTLADDNRKLLSRGSCSCTSGYSNSFGKALECTIPYKMEITSPNNPNTRYGGPSTSISK